MPRLTFLSTAHIHAQSFLENIVQSDDGRVVHAIWDERPERGRRYAEQFRARFEPQLEAALADPAVDGFVVCAENTRHLPLLRAVLPLGKPVFCEKPLVTTTVELREVRALLARHRTPLFCGYFYPFEPVMQSAAERLRAGAFGQVTRVRFRNAHNAAYGRWFDSADLAWFREPALAGGGAFMDVGSHAVHLLRRLFGPVEAVWATIGNQAGTYPEVDDFGIAHLRFATGVLGTVEAAWTQTGGLDGLEIVGSHEALWKTPEGYVRGRPGVAPQALETTGVGGPTRIDRLVAVIRGEIPAAELADDLAATMDCVSIVEACYASAKSGRWENVAC